MDSLELSGILILLLGLALLTISLGQLGHHVTEGESAAWFWYLLIGIAVISVILGGTLLYRKYDQRKTVVSLAKTPSRPRFSPSD